MSTFAGVTPMYSAKISKIGIYAAITYSLLRFYLYVNLAFDIKEYQCHHLLKMLDVMLILIRLRIWNRYADQWI